MRILLILMSLGLLVGCMEPAPTHYPLSDETCGPSDPVKDMTPINCIPSAA